MIARKNEMQHPEHSASACKDLQDDASLEREEGSRWLELAAGSALLAAGLAGSSRIRKLLAIAGGGLLYQGLSGRCILNDVRSLAGRIDRELQALIGSGCTTERRASRSRPVDPVTQCSEESFPASDPPSWSPGRA